MAYVTHYSISFTNELSQPVEILIQRKDGDVQDVVDYIAEKVTLTYNGDEGKYATIIGRTLEMEFSLLENQTDFFDAFMAAQTDTYKVIVTIDKWTEFIGFILPDEGGRPFQDKPFTCKLTATDRLGLLKEIPLSWPDETNFSSYHKIITYVGAILQKTGLALPIRVYDNIYHTSMLDRSDGLENDFVGQAYVENRTFLKDATTFEDCYTCLDRICKDAFRIFQYKGRWVMIRIALLQYIPFDTLYYSEYDYNGANPVGQEVTDNYMTVGKNEMIYPINEDQMRYAKIAANITRTTFNYDIWPEIPKNNKWERGDYLSQSTATDESDIDGDGDFSENIGTLKQYEIADWNYGQFSFNEQTEGFPLTSDPMPPPRIRKVFNVYDVEIIREIEVGPSPNAGDGIVATAVRSEGVPVVQGDRIKFAVDKRFDADYHSGDDNNYSAAAVVFILPDGGGDTWVLLNSFTEPTKDGLWTTDEAIFSFIPAISVRFGDQDTRRYTSVSVESQPIPCNGTMYVLLINRSETATSYYRNFSLEYFPMVAGGFQDVKGEYWETKNANLYPDKTDQEIYLADNPHKVFKGCLLDSSGVPFTPQFRRYGINETKPYNQLINYNKFNLEQRRYWFIEGSFTGLTCQPSNNQENIIPIGLHYQYRFVDIEGKDKRFMLGAPLEMDLISGNCTMRFYEVWTDTHLFMDGKRSGTTTFKYIF